MPHTQLLQVDTITYLPGEGVLSSTCEYYVGLVEIKWFEVALLRLADSLFCLILPWTTTQRIVHLLSRTVQMILTTSNSSESASELDL